MPFDIPRPNITASTEAGRLEQVRSYLYQMVDQLNFALNSVERQMETVEADISQQISSSSETTPEEAQRNFNEVKSLIIKSADIVEAYSEVIEKKLEGRYMASSAFGDYTEETITNLIASEKKFEQNISNLQTIFDEDGNIKAELLVNGHIYSGIIEYAKDGEAIIGIEVGQTTTDADGNKKFDKFARFTASKLSFYDVNNTEVAYISDHELVITTARILGDLIFGESSGYRLDTSDGIAFIWEERKG